jgi:hypothetical protein
MRSSMPLPIAKLIPFAVTFNPELFNDLGATNLVAKRAETSAMGLYH